MDSSELISARIAESDAQRAYDRTAALFSALLTLLAVAIPVAFGLMVLLHTQAENQRQRALSEVLHWESRSFQTFGECIDRPPPISEVFCEHFWSNIGLAEDAAAEARSLGSSTLHIGAIALLLIFVAGAIGFLSHGQLKDASAMLGQAQARRIRAESEAERKSRRHGSKIRYQAARRSAGINERVRPRRLRLR